MAIKVTVGQTTFIKKIVIGTPVTTARESLSIDEFTDFNVGTKSDGQILVYDSAEGAFKNYTLTAGNAIQKQYNAGTDVLQIQLDSDASPTLSGLTLKGHLLPSQDSAFDLGDSALKFRDLYLSGSTINLGGLKLSDSSGGFAVKDSQGQAVNFDLAGSRAQIRGFFSGQGDLTYDSSTGVFQFDVEDVYTKANFDSDFNLALDSAALEGVGLKYTNATNTLAIDSSELYSFFKHDDFNDFVADEHVAHSGVTITAGDGLTGGGTIASSRTINVVGGKGIIANANDIQVDSANIRGMFIANKGLSYDSETGTFNIDSANVRGMFIGNKGFTYDSELGTFDIDSANVRAMFTGGEGIHSTVSSTGIIKIDSAELYNFFNHDEFSDFVANEHIDHTTVSVIAGKGLTGGGTIAADRTIDIDSSNVRNMFSGTNGISYTAGTGVIRAPQPLDSAAKPVFAGINADSGHITALSAETIQRTSVVTAATYGSATQIPVLIVDSSGFIDSATTVTVAGVASTSFDSSTGIFTINTADGNSFTTHIQDSADHVRISRASLSATDAGGDGSFTYDKSTGVLTYTGPSASEVRAHLSGNKGLTYNSSTGVFDIDSANIDNVIDSALGEVSVIAGAGLIGGGTIVSDRTLNVVGGKGIIANADDIQIDSANVRGIFSGGTGITYNSGTGEFTTTDGEIVHDNLSGFVADEHVAHGGVIITAGKGLTGGGSIASSRTIDVDSANLVTMSRNALSGANGISYTAGTGVIRAPQPLDSNANPTFNQLRGPSEFIIDPAAIGNATGTVKILGDLQVDGVTTQLNSTTLSVNDKTIVLADSSADSSALNGAGIIWGGDSVLDNPSLLYSHSNARLDFNRSISVTGTVNADSATFDQISIPDGNFNSNRMSFGDADDFTIFHNGSNTFLRDQGTGALFIQSSRFLTQDLSSNTQIDAKVGGSVDLYYDGDKKLETTAYGATVTGTINADSATINIISIPDGAAGGTTNRLNIGDDDDLKIFHDGSNSHISDQGTGDLTLSGTNNIILKSSSTGGEYYAIFRNNGASELYHNNVKKFETSDSGVNIIGDIRLDNVDFTNNGIIDSARLPLGTFAAGGGGGSGNLDSALAIDLLTKNVIRFGTDVQFDSAGGILFDQSDQALEFGDNYQAKFGDAGDLAIYHDGSRSFISDQGTGNIRVLSNNVEIKNSNDNSLSAKFLLSGAVDLYYNGTKRLETTDYGATVTGTMNADSATIGNDLRVAGSVFISGAGGTGLTLNNTLISGVNYLEFNDPGNQEGLRWNGGNTQLFESPNDLSNASGNLQVTHGGVRRFSVTDSGAEVVGQLLVDSATASGNIRADGGNLIIGDEALSSNTGYVGMKTSFQSNSNDYMIVSGNADGNTYLSAKNGSSVFIRAGGNVDTAQIGVSATTAIAYGDFQFDSGSAIMFDKSDQALEVNAATHSINLVDDAKINFGTGNDLEIYHGGGHSIIRENNDNRIYIQSSNTTDGVLITKKFAGETMAKFIADGAVELYHNNSKKFETTSTGATVTGLLSATTKSFDIEHPTKEGMRLRYGSLEGPENGVYVRGRATSSIIELPEYWTGLVDEDTITVELTPIGKHQKLYVEDIADNKIIIGNDNLINKKINCFYIVYGERKDVDKITVEY